MPPKNSNLSNYPVAESSSDDVLRNFAHEIRTPLNGMLGYTYLIAEAVKNGGDSATIGDYNQSLRTATTRLLQICERVLDEAVTGESIVVRQNVNASEVANSVVETFRALAAERRVDLRCEFPANFPILQTDPLLLSQALSNLVSNAIKFTPGGGSVTVRGEFSHTDDAMIFIIQDTGAGVSADLLMRMRRGDVESTAERHGHKGWGRGLKIADALCGKIGAELRLEKARSGGTVAMISVPVNPP
ncbi:MAG: HAMP domain-containing histidine kinase [Rhodospirillales bacterium]|nr:HAMP domain-containing histidine kinase [Rhodospirillales bacterium]MBO6787772.1 HAMP domain-containing histidine kinase [Rhodospirillales bacterium]